VNAIEFDVDAELVEEFVRQTPVLTWASAAGHAVGRPRQARGALRVQEPSVNTTFHFRFSSCFRE
jgi:hypothetical protein